MAFDCGPVKTCFYGCVCDATSCSSRREGGVTSIELDGALTTDGEALVGTLVLPTRTTVRLTKH